MLKRQAVLLYLVCTFVALPGFAQVGISVPPTTDDVARGVHIGDFVFRPAVAFSGGYHSNLFRQDASEGRSHAAILSLSPQFLLHNPQASWLRMTWEAIGGFHWYLSPDPRAVQQGRYSAETTFRTEFLPRSVVGFFVADRFIRDIQPRNYSSSQTFDRNFNHAEAGIQIRPGGPAMEIALSYAFNMDLFDSFSEGDLFYHEARLLTTWDLLPKTSLFLDANWRMISWENPLAGMREDSMPLQVVAGMRGLITPKIALLAKAGYARAFFRQGADVQTGIGEASIAFFPTLFTVIDAGYKRRLEDSYYGRFFTDDEVHLHVTQQIVRRINLIFEGRWSRMNYGAFEPPAESGLSVNQIRRRDDVFKVRAVGDFSFFRYVSAHIGYQLEANITPFTIIHGNNVDYGRFVAHQAFAGLKVMY